MSNTFMKVEDVATELGVSKSYAYKVVRRLNTDLKNMGYLTIAGRISKKYFIERLCYDEHNRKGAKHGSI